MKSKTNIRTATALAVACSVLLGVAATNGPYTVNVANGAMVFTNVVSVSKCPGNGTNSPDPDCILIRYVGQYGVGTNEFHAWRVPLTATKNRVK